jgi:hypothetical protein
MIIDAAADCHRAIHPTSRQAGISPRAGEWRGKTQNSPIPLNITRTTLEEKADGSTASLVKKLFF